MENEYEVITETYYRCPICHQAYKVLKEAEECLSGHVYPKEIVGCTYSGFGVPTELTVKISDGSKATYQLHRLQKEKSKTGLKTGGQSHE